MNDTPPPIAPHTVASPATKCRRAAPNPKPVAVTPDPWQDWQPQWRQPAAPRRPRRTRHAAPVAATVHEQQETHSPSRRDRTPEGERARRIVDARLWETMTDIQQEAAVLIAAGFEAASRGLGYTQSNWEKIPGSFGAGLDIGEAHLRLVGYYMDWARACIGKKIMPAIILDVLVFGHSCTAVDRGRRMRNGTTRALLADGLNLYCFLRGWTKNP